VDECKPLPDGPTRTAAALHPTNADSEERLCAAIWQGLSIVYFSAERKHHSRITYVCFGDNTAQVRR
jgi:hypothetical protein